MAWPFSRLRTYAPGSQVPSADLNAIQDEAIAKNNRTIHFSPGLWHLGPSESDLLFSEAGNLVTSVISTGTKFGQIDLTPFLTVGVNIKELVIRWKNGATAASGLLDFHLVGTEVAANGSPDNDTLAAIGTLDTSTGGALAARSHTLAVGEVVEADRIYNAYISMDATAGDDQAAFGVLTLVLGV